MRALLLAVLVTAALHGAGAQYCSPGAVTVCDAVLVVCADGELNCADVQSMLRGTGAFAKVDTFNAQSAADGGSDTPTAELLAAYHAVLAFSHFPFSNAALLGDRLAAYHDQGGGVVVALSANANAFGTALEGAYGAPGNGYAIFNYASGAWTYPLDSDTLGGVMEPQSPLMLGVASLAATEAYRSSAGLISGRGVVVARWLGGGQEPLVVRGTRGNRTLVELNFYPPSSSGLSTSWTGDGAALLRNALKYSRCMPSWSGTSSTAGGVDGKGEMVCGQGWVAAHPPTQIGVGG